jgi:hypothetical protein
MLLPTILLLHDTPKTLALPLDTKTKKTTLKTLAWQEGFAPPTEPVHEAYIFVRTKQ